MALKLEDRATDLERRASELEGSFQLISGQLKAVHKSLIDFQAEANQRFDGIDRRFDRLDARTESGFGAVNAKLDAVPETVASAVAGASRK